MKIGVISDTHGLLRPEALEALRGCDRILHAGDVGDPAILTELARLAPVEAVRGNCDHGELSRLPYTLAVELEGISLYMVHIPEDLDLDPRAAGVRVVIHGNTHRPRCEERDGVLFLNPGSAGPRRFDYPITLVHLFLEAGRIRPELIDLEGSFRSPG